MLFSLGTKVKFRCSYKHRHFENTKLLAGNDHVIDIFTSEDMENILLCIFSILLSTSEMNITGTLPQAGNLKLFVPSLSTQSSTRPKQNIFNVVLMRPDKTE